MTSPSSSHKLGFHSHAESRSSISIDSVPNPSDDVNDTVELSCPQLPQASHNVEDISSFGDASLPRSTLVGDVTPAPASADGSDSHHSSNSSSSSLRHQVENYIEAHNSHYDQESIQWMSSPQTYRRRSRPISPGYQELLRRAFDEHSPVRYEPPSPTYEYVKEFFDEEGVASVLQAAMDPQVRAAPLFKRYLEERSIEMQWLDDGRGGRFFQVPKSREPTAWTNEGSDGNGHHTYDEDEPCATSSDDGPTQPDWASEWYQ